jgi:ArsR family transcriptional regulator
MLRPHDGIFGLQASILKTIASPRRLEIIHLLGTSGPMEVHRLAAHFGLAQPAISQHLAALRAAGLVESVRLGRDVSYRLTDPEIVQACELMRQVLVRRIASLGDMAASYTGQRADSTPAKPIANA